VRHELAENGKPRRYSRVLERGVHDREHGVHERGRPPEPHYGFFVHLAHRKAGKRPAISAPSDGWASLSSGFTTQLWVPGLTLFITATSSRFLQAKPGSLYTGRMPHTLSERLGFSDAVEDADHRLPRGDHRHATRK
jgi:hypothetical protein